MMEVLDAHTHVDESPALGWMDPPEMLIPLLDEAGIRRAVIMAYRDAPAPHLEAFEYVAAAAERYPDRLWAFVRLNPRQPTEAERLLRYAIRERGFKGLKLHPVSFALPPGHALVVDLIRAAGQLHVPVLFHSGDDGQSTPLEIAPAAAACPEATIILGHMGGYFHTADAIDVARTYPNMYLETSAMPYPWRIRDAVRAIGPDRVLFGSDGPGCQPALELDKVRRAGLAEADLELVLGGNLRRLLARGPGA
jgi:uncharacterized protein